MNHKSLGPAFTRTIPITVSAFNHIKDTQRKHEAETGQRLSLNDAFNSIILDHQRLTESQVQRSNVPAVLRPL